MAREAAVAKGTQIRKDIEQSIHQKQVEMKKIRDEMAAETKAAVLIGTLDGVSADEESD